MHSEVYSDGIGEITVTGPIIRMDFVSMGLASRDGGAAPATRVRVVMPAAALAGAIELMQKALHSVTTGGAMVPDRDIIVPDHPVRPTASAGHASAGRSPNFSS